ncbi:putative leucine-rich repeat-containing protein DDB_G0290503 isoform X1 [Hetaerina americana]|uniref:putative leucine-rich repeat-containing protein DDB_G0290503 isoform X1 n=1 Tax=Hetaerina americana TaxID=62018 RepID=UPI003A7F4DDD
MASNLLNNQLKQLQKLGKDVDDLEKKLNKAFDDVDNVKSSSNGSGRNAGSITETSKRMPNALIKNHRNKPKSSQRKPKSATLEVTVKTKRHGKSSKANVSSEIGTKNDSKRSKPHEDIVPNEKVQHCCCQSNSKNVVWSNILKHSEIPNSTLPNSKEGRIIPCDARCDDHLKRDTYDYGCRVKHSISNSHQVTLCPSVHDSRKEIAGSDVVCNDLVNHKKCSKEDSGAKNIPQLSDDGRLEQKPTNYAVHPVSGSSLQPIDNLCILMEELRRTTANQPTQMLVKDMEAALKRLCQVAAKSPEAPVTNELSSKNGSYAGAALTISKDTDERIKMYPNKTSLVANAMVQVPPIHNTENNYDSTNDGRIKEDNLKSQNGLVQNNQKKFAVAEKFELLVKVNDDDGAGRHYLLGNDEKLKAEIEYLNKQLNLQLKSVEGLSTKDSEYHKLISNLIEKVDKLESQVNEQTKVTQHFYGQSNSLLEQNRVIPKMQKKIDHLNKQLQDTSQNYEKLKIEYCLVKLERERFYILNCEKDKEITKFKDEIRKIQSLVSQQLQDLKSYAGYSSAAEKVDMLLSAIDSQSNLIKSKISGAKELTGANISGLESMSSSSSGSQSRPVSPFSYSVRLSSPDKVFKPLNEADGHERSTADIIH